MGQPEKQPERQAASQPQNLPKALRIGVIQGGKIVEERLIRKRQNVTVGQSNKNTFVVPSPTMPRTYTLFEAHGERYFLNFTDQMDGRVAVGEQPVPLAQLREGQKAVRRSTGWALPLPDKARGKVTLGDVTFLFQFVAAPPVAARPQLPPSIRGSLLDRIDVYLTCILGASFLLHLVILAVLNTVHLPDHPDVSVVPDYVTDLIIPPKEQAKPKPTTVATTGADAQKTTQHHATHNEASKGGDNKPAKAVDPVEEARRQAAETAAKVNEARNYGVLAAFGAVDANDPNAVAGTNLAGADVDINRVASRIGGVEAGNGNAPGGVLGSAVGNGQGKVGSIGVLAAAGPAGERATGARAQDTEAAAHVSTGHAAIDDTTGIGNLTQSGIESELRHLQGALQACYSRELKNSPGMKHVKISIAFTIGPHGTVTDASTDNDEGGDGALENCIMSVIRGQARFSPPPLKPLDVTFPWIFTTG